MTDIFSLFIETMCYCYSAEEMSSTSTQRTWAAFTLNGSGDTNPIFFSSYCKWQMSDMNILAGKKRHRHFSEILRLFSDLLRFSQLGFRLKMQKINICFHCNILFFCKAHYNKTISPEHLNSSIGKQLFEIDLGDFVGESVCVKDKNNREKIEL